MRLRRIATVVLTTLATIIGLAMFFLGIGPLVAGRFDLVAFNAAVFGLCLWYITKVMRADRRERRAEEERLPPEDSPRQPRRPVTFQLKETGAAFVIWALIVGVIGVATGQPLPVTIGMAVFAGFMLATITVAGRHMMFRLTAEEDEAPSDPAAKGAQG